jgi:predicted Zn-dependent peptidase
MTTRLRSLFRCGLADGRAVVLALATVALSAVVAHADTLSRYKHTVSPTGLPFYWRHDMATPFAAINFGFRDIYGLTTRGKEGLSALGGSLAIQGADASSQNELTEKLRDLTASASLSIGPFNTTGTVRAPSSTIAPATSLLATALKSAAPTEKLLARLRQRAEDGEAQAAMRAETVAERAALRIALSIRSASSGLGSPTSRNGAS